MVDRAFFEAHMAGGAATTTTATKGQPDEFAAQGNVDVSSGGAECVALLPQEFVPTKFDVICQRGKECFEHGKLAVSLWMQDLMRLLVISLWNLARL